MPPGRVQNLDDYWDWLDGEVESSGGFLADGPLHVTAVPAVGEPTLLIIPSQRIHFHNDRFMQFGLTVNAEFVLLKYSYCYMEQNGAVIWRADNTGTGHGLPPGPHLHRDNKREPVVPFRVVEFDEALERRDSLTWSMI